MVEEFSGQLPSDVHILRQLAGIGRYTRGLVRALAEIDRENRYVLFSAGRDPQALHRRRVLEAAQRAVAGQAQLKEAYVIVRDAAILLLNAHITPLKTASTHVNPEPTRTRKLLLNAAEIRKLIGKVERAGYSLVPLDLHYSKGRIKLEFGLAKGKRQFEKRASEADKDWKREQNRLLKQRSR